jgi:hypothetical protein
MPMAPSPPETWDIVDGRLPAAASFCHEAPVAGVGLGSTGHPRCSRAGTRSGPSIGWRRGRCTLVS